MTIQAGVTRVIGVVAALFISMHAFAQEKHVVMGAGPSTFVAELFFGQISRSAGGEKYVFEIDPRSIKHAGGILSSDTHLFGRTGRLLDAAERANNKKEIVLARIPVAVVAGSKAGVQKITLSQLEGIFTRKITNWRELGGADHPIVLMGREPTEAAFVVLKNAYPFFNTAVFDETLTRDHQVVNFMRSTKGEHAIGFGAKPNFEGMKVLAVEKFEPSMSVGLVYDGKNSDHPLVQLAQAHAKGNEWRKLLKKAELYPPE